MSGIGFLKTAGTIGFLTLVSRILGFVREQAIAGQFGATGQTDAYQIGFTVPFFIGGMLGAFVGTPFLPVFTQHITEGNIKKAWEVSYVAATFVTTVGLILAVAGFFSAEWLVALLAPGFEGETFHQAVLCTKIIFPGIIFIFLSDLARAILNSFKNFNIPATVPLVQNIVVICCILTLTHMGVISLAVGMLLGMICMCCIQFPFLYNKGMRFRQNFRFFKDPEFRKIARLALPVIAGSIFGRLYILFDRRLASQLTEGSIAALSFADTIRMLPQELFITAVATVLFPALSEKSAQKDREGVRDTLMYGLRLAALVTIPSAVGLAVLREPIVRIIYQRGAFDEAATAATASAVLCYSAGIIATGFNSLLICTFYGMQKTVTPVLIGVIKTVANIILNYLLVVPMAHNGLALANSLASFISTILLFTALSRHLDHLFSTRFLLTLGKVILASSVMGLAASSLGKLAGIFTGQQGIVMGTVSLAAVIVFSALLYTALILLLKVEELRFLTQLFKRKNRLL
jgi:putative peptidoglycan lipid II flippase